MLQTNNIITLGEHKVKLDVKLEYLVNDRNLQFYIKCAF
jgi:hypothetical protein